MFCMHITTQRLYITEFDEGMATQLHLNSLDDDIRRFVPDEVFETVDIARDKIAWFICSYTQDNAPLVHPVLLHNGRQIGYVQACPLKKGWEIGYHIAKEFTGNGYATEALCAFLPPVMAKLGISRIYGICRADNLASRRVLDKCGFQLEFERKQKYHGKRRLVRQYQLTATEER